MGKGLSSPVYPGSRNKAEGLARLLWFLCKGLGLSVSWGCGGGWSSKDGWECDWEGGRSSGEGR